MLTARLDTDVFYKTLAEPLQRHIPFAISHALNRTMREVRKDQQAQMHRYFDNKPNRYTKSAPQVDFSSKRHLETLLYYGDRAAYVKTLIRGGTVVAQKRKLIEPVGSGTNKAGRLSKSYIKRNKDKPRFFIGIPRGRPDDQRYYGVWRRYGKGGYTKAGKPRGRLKLMVSMKQNQRHQDAIFPSGELAAIAFQKRIYRQIPASFRYAFRTSNKRARNLKFR